MIGEENKLLGKNGSKTLRINEDEHSDKTMRMSGDKTIRMSGDKTIR